MKSIGKMLSLALLAILTITAYSQTRDGWKKSKTENAWSKTKDTLEYKIKIGPETDRFVFSVKRIKVSPGDKTTEVSVVHYISGTGVPTTIQNNTPPGVDVFDSMTEAKNLLRDFPDFPESILTDFSPNAKKTDKKLAQFISFK